MKKISMKTIFFFRAYCVHVALVMLLLSLNAVVAKAQINGTLSVCVNATTTLTDATTGGTWSTSNPVVATVGSSSGIVTGGTAGTARITYTVSGSPTTAVVTVNANPLPIQGVTSECIGITNLLTDGSSGGAWSSSTPSVGSIDASGNMTGVSTGTTTITYTLPTGCLTTYPNTVYANPSAILGTTSVCAGATTQLSDATSGGLSYTSSTHSVATVDNSGTVTGVAAGTTTITYTILHGCYATTTVTVNALPSAILGSTPVCAGLTITLTDPDGSGTWTSSSTSKATIGSASGVVTGISSGTSTISYIASGGDGCAATVVVTVNSVAAITGSLPVCNGSTTSLNDATTGGTWSSSNAGVGTVGTSGIVTSISVGTTSITYTSAPGCITSVTVSVNTMPTAILGTASMCAGNTTSLSDATSGGTWASNTPIVATVGTNGLVSGSSTHSGTATITYAIASCYVTQVVTVNPNPLPVQGATSICVGITALLTDGTSGGAWSSSTPSVGSIDASGNVTGVSTGTSTITYTLSTGCYVTYPNTVLPNPSAILGTTTVCAGATTVLSDATSGSLSYTSSTVSVATVDNSGTVTGVAAGTTTITYKITSGCYTTTVVTVEPLPSAILGNTPVCIGLTITLTDADGSGTWTSSNTSVATIGSSSGVLTGGTAGTSIITFVASGGDGCQITAVVTANATPAINGASAVCQGFTITLSDATPSGTWSSSNTAVGTVGTSGIVAGLSVGTTIITYTIPAGCINTLIVTVNIQPTAILGTASMCNGGSTSLSDATSGGAWATSAPLIASVGTDGTVSSASPYSGTSTISYTIGSCFATQVATVNPNPLPVQGATSECLGITVLLTDGTSGGAWSSSTPSVGSIDGSGNFTSLTVGTTTVTYTLTTGCYTTYPNTVLPNPSAILGTTAVCVGGTTVLSDATSGALSFTSSTPSIATVDNGGNVTGVAAGTTTITYTVTSGCYTTTTVTVDAVPPAITGNIPVCVTYTVTLADPAGAGTWSSANVSIATIGSSSGILTGVAAGTTTVTYTETGGSSGCNQVTAVVTINVAAAISGSSIVCTGATITLTDASGSGTWSSSATSVGTIGSTSGIVTGIATGTTSITYTSGAGCVNTTTITVNPSPAAISGSSTVCSGSSTITLTDATPSGTWSSSNTAIATVGSATGVVTSDPSDLGTVTITYTAGGCYATKALTVNPNPLPVQGANGECEGITILLTDATSGGAWSSSTPANGSIDGSGNVTGIVAGTTTITYTIGTGCYTTYPNTIHPNPSSILGTATVCVGSTTSLSDATSGGLSFTSSTPSVATVDNGGTVTGIAGGTATITYTILYGCIATTVVTVNTLPGSITGNTPVCVTYTVTLADPAGAGTWSSANVSIATIGSSTGTVTGVGAGTTTVTYTESGGGSGCNQATAVVTINAAAAISGPSIVCTGATITLTDASGSGTWSSSATSVGTIGSTSGVVTGIATGTTSITYTSGAGCVNTTTITVNPSPAAISGASTLCSASSSITLTDATSSGTWSSSNTAIATVGSATGVVTSDPSNTGNVTITYTAGGCYATKALTVNPNPLPIQGAASECQGFTTLLTDATSGGAWSSSTPANGSIDGSGDVTGVAVGTTTITYTIGTGCYVTYPNTILANPSAILGTTTACVGGTTNLSDATSGALSFTSSTVSVATINNAGNVTGVSAGTTTITYTITSGCYTTTVVTVLALPASISGNTPLCPGTNITLTDAAGSGTWTSSNTAVATIGSSSGVVAALTDGTTRVTYTETGISVCNQVTAIVTVSPVAAISGSSAACLGSNITLSDATTGGTWSSSNTAVGTIGTDGTFTAISVGTTSVTYTTIPGCTTAKTITVNTAPTSINGTFVMCGGGTTTLTDATSGGTWSTSSPLIATVGGTTGVVSGSSIYSGTATITYGIGSCTITQVVTVNANPLPVQGVTYECVGITNLLTDGTAGGAWSSSTPAVGSIDGSGNMTGVAAGTTTITYTLSTGCYVTYPNTVRANPAAISGTLTVCAGSTTQLSDATSGALSYTSSTVSVATVINSGTVTGVSAGTSTITYKITTGCYITAVVTVVALPAAITGNSPVCAGSTVSLTDAAGTGTWVSSKTLVATVGTSGVVTGVAGGTATISYTASTGCTVTTIATVNAISAITGTLTTCVGSTTTLADAATGGTWVSGTTSVATIGSSSGVVTGVSLGTSAITYTTGAGCTATTTVTIESLSAITGTATVCTRYTTNLTDASAGGTWRSSYGLVATVDGTGLVTASTYQAGTATISYSLGTCVATQVVTVSATPLPVQGATFECQGVTVTLSDGTAGGAWSSSNSNVSIDGSGNATGSSVGTATISYTISSTGCYVTYPNTVRANPAAITGTFTVCAGATTQLSDVTANPISYTSSNVSVATVINDGAVTGVAAGTATITYKILSGCIATQVVTVDAPAVTSILGPSTVSQSGGAVTFSDATTGGVWVSSDATVIALTGSTANPITANATATSGSATISYSVTDGAGCTTTVTKSVSAAARFAHFDSTVNSIITLYAGAKANITDLISGGSWASNNDGIATVDGNGVVTGMIPGNTDIIHVASGNKTTVTPIVVIPFPVDVSIIPNPNKGTFTIKGILGTAQSEEATLEIIDMLGQVIYKNNVTAIDGRINEIVSLGNELPNGMYILNVHSGSGRKIFHFVIEQ